jgi:hypothetical protein
MAAGIPGYRAGGITRCWCVYGYLFLSGDKGTAYVLQLFWGIGIVSLYLPCLFAQGVPAIIDCEDTHDGPSSVNRYS